MEVIPIQNYKNYNSGDEDLTNSRRINKPDNDLNSTRGINTHEKLTQKSFFLVRILRKKNRKIIEILLVGLLKLQRQQLKEQHQHLQPQDQQQEEQQQIILQKFISIAE